MIILLSPSKTLDFKPLENHPPISRPLFLKKAGTIAGKMKSLNLSELRYLLGISEKLAKSNHTRYIDWSEKHLPEDSKAAILAFKGDVYQGLGADDFSAQELEFSQNHVRILSGLYGYLKPLDFMMPHRLEMATLLPIDKHNDLYEYWQEDITKEIIRELKKSNSKALVNLASKEYSDAVDFKRIEWPVIQPVFMDYSSGKYRVISFFAKKARGMMTRYIVKNRITNPEQMKLFNAGGYYFDAVMSSENKWLFTRG